MTIMTFDNVFKAYSKGSDVLSGISFQIQPGEVAGLLGKNGAGKTTLIRIAMGMMGVDKGDVRILDMHPRNDALAIRKRIGYVSEDQVLPSYLTVLEILEFHRSLYPTWDQDMASDLASRFQLPPNSKIADLSKGQARQVALLCAVSHRPELLILDEPAGGLDPSARREFLETSIHLLNDAGSTILFSSHHMTDVERMANRILMIHDGNLKLDCELDHLQENSSLALIPMESHSPNLAQLDGCLSIRKRANTWHAAFSHPPEKAEAILEQGGVKNVRCARIGLEELFIELAGGE